MKEKGNGRPAKRIKKEWKTKRKGELRNKRKEDRKMK